MAVICELYRIFYEIVMNFILEPPIKSPRQKAPHFTVDETTMVNEEQTEL